jgi:hypothetical protein
VCSSDLLWDAIDVETGKEVKVMDRIYCMDDNKNIHYFKEWADENGYISRKNQKWADCLRFQKEGNDMKIKLSVKIKQKAYASYPYVDTFKFWDEKKGIISNFIPQDNGYIRTMIINDGRTLASNALCFDDYQETFENTERLVKLDYEINGKYWRVLGELLNYSEIQDRYMLKEHSGWSDEVGDYIFTGEWAKFNNSDILELKNKKKDKFGKRHIVDGPEDFYDDFDDFLPVDEEPQQVEEAQNNAQPIPPYQPFGQQFLDELVQIAIRDLNINFNRNQ